MVLETQQERLNSIDITEAPEDINRSSHETVIEDGSEFNPGETLRLRATFTDKPYDVFLDGEKLGTVAAGSHFRFEAPSVGEHTITVGDREIPITVEPRDSSTPSSENTVGNADDWTNVDDSDEIDPSNYAGIVNADNEQGVALAPSLRREGMELGPEGATVTLPDGETVDVGAISDADEVARYTSGSNTGDVVESDQDATDSGSSTTSDALGASGAILGALALAYMLYRRQ